MSALSALRRDQAPKCPICGTPSIYHELLDRYFHLDGSNNQPCWAAINRGETWSAR